MPIQEDPLSCAKVVQDPQVTYMQVTSTDNLKRKTNCNNYFAGLIRRGTNMCAARVSLAMGDTESLLPLVLGPPDAWNSLVGPLAAVDEGRARRVKSQSASQFEPLQARFRWDTTHNHQFKVPNSPMLISPALILGGHKKP